MACSAGNCYAVLVGVGKDEQTFPNSTEVRPSIHVLKSDKLVPQTVRVCGSVS